MVRLDANLPSVDADIDADISEAIADGIQRYEPLTPNDAGWLWSDQLELFLGIQGQQIRWFSAKGQLIPLPEEAERQAKEEAQQRAQQAQQRAERLEVLL